MTTAGGREGLFATLKNIPVTLLSLICKQGQLQLDLK